MSSQSRPTTAWTFILRSLRYFGKTHLTVSAGIAAATAVIVGALVVGDSVRGSLRGLVVNRMANIECVLHARTFFSTELLDTLQPGQDTTDAAVQEFADGATYAPAIIVESSTAENRSRGEFHRESQVQVIAVDNKFFAYLPAGSGDLFKTASANANAQSSSEQTASDQSSGEKSSSDQTWLGEDEIAINASLAIELVAEVGDELSLRLTNPSGVPADNPLGRRDEAYVSLPRQKIVAILPDASVGGVSFRAGQSVPRNIFASLATVQDIFEEDKKANAALVLVKSPSRSANEYGQAFSDALNLQLAPKLEDYGLQLTHHQLDFTPPKTEQPATPEQKTEAETNGDNEAPANDASPPTEDPETTEGSENTEGPETTGDTVVYDYWQLSSDELILDTTTSDAVMNKLGSERATRLLTYLANSIARVEPTERDLSSRRRASRFERPASSHNSPNVDRIGTINLTIPTASISISGQVESADEAPTPPGPQPELSRLVPYSILVGVDVPSELNLHEYTVDRPELQYPYCWINSWTAEQLEAKAGDWIQIKFFQPETLDGRRVEDYQRFMVAGVVPITKPSTPYRRRAVAKFTERPTIFNDPNLTPSVPGVTDQDSISNWDLPFPLELQDEILPVDDEYWNDYRLTPKIFMPHLYASFPQLFGSRFGDTTAIRIPAENVASQEQLRSEIEEALLTARQIKGLLFLPVRTSQLQAASGTTPFDMLFLSLSFFVIVAALLLVTLLFKLGIQKRTSQLGLLAAEGFSASRIQGLLLRELLIVATVGAVAGVALGIGYARLMIAGLESWWIGAISSPFLTFSFSWQSLLIGSLAGLLASLIAIYMSLRKLSRFDPLSLLRGQDPESRRVRGKLNRVALAIAGFAAIASIGLGVSAIGQTGMARAGSFFGSGILLLAGMLIFIRQWIENGASQQASLGGNGLFQLAMRAITRNPVRSSLSLGLLSVASFLIASMGVFQVSPNERGYGGFNLIGETSQPIYENISSASVRSEALGEKAKELNSSTIIPLRMRRGEDASCTNLFQVSEPTVLGIPELLSTYYEYAPGAPRFDFVGSTGGDTPWDAIKPPATGSAEDPIPVIIDQNTAAWSLKQGASLGAIVELEFEKQTLFFETVGLLSNSVLQGKLMISQANFQRAFPEISGYQYFLIRSGEGRQPAEVASLLEQGWSGVGFDVTRSDQILSGLLGVQNTYISAFQSLGALGLLLGTFGLIAVQVRSVIERRRELALMQAVGFSHQRIARMLTLETAILLVGGLAIGVFSAAIALIPYVIEVGPQLSILSPLVMLSLVFLAGFIAATLAVRTATKQSLLPNLRSE